MISTDRLTLRRFDANDAGFVLELLNDPSFIRNIGDRGVRTEDAAREYIAERFEKSYERHGFGLYAVVLADTGATIGMSGLIRRDTLPDVDVGYAFLPAFRSKGYAVEAGRAVMAHARDAIGLKRVVAIVLPENRPSVRVLEALGLVFEKTRCMPGESVDVALYAVDF